MYSILWSISSVGCYRTRANFQGMCILQMPAFCDFIFKDYWILRIITCAEMDLKLNFVVFPLISTITVKF